MKPTYMELCAFGPFADKVTIPFDNIVSEGVFLIHGATGAGKTTIFDAISFALFGNPSGENRPTDSLRSDFAKEERPTYVILEFTHAGKQYRVERRPAYRRPKQRGEGFTESKADAVLLLPDGNVVAGYQNVTERMTELLAVDWRQFKQLSMIAQGEFVKLLTVESKDRGEIFRKIFHTGELGRIGKSLKERALNKKRLCEEADRSIVQYLMGMEAPEQGEEQEIIKSWKRQPQVYAAKEMQTLLGKIVNSDAKEYELCKENQQIIEQSIDEYRVRQAKAVELKQKEEELYSLRLECEKNPAQEAVLEQEKLRLFFAKKALLTVNPVKEDYLKVKNEREQLLSVIEERNVQLCRLKEQEEEIVLRYQKAQAGKIRMEELYAKVESAKTEVMHAKQRTKCQEKVKELSVEYEGAYAACEELKKEIRSLEEEYRACRQAAERITQIYHQGVELEKAEREIKQWCSAVSEQKERFRSYETTKNRYEQLVLQLSEKLKRQQELESELSGMEKRYLCEQAGVLADGLRSGEACPVCGSTSHPAPARHEGKAPTKEELDGKRAEAECLRKETDALSKEAAMEKSTMQLLLEYLSKPREQSEPVRFDTLLAYEQEEERAGKRLEQVQAEIEELLLEQQRLRKEMDREPQLAEGLSEKRELLELKQDDLHRLGSQKMAYEAEIKKLTLKLTAENEKEAEEALCRQKELLEQTKTEIQSAEEAYYEWDNRLQGEKAVLEQLNGQKLARAMAEQSAKEQYALVLQECGFDTEEDYESALMTQQELLELERALEQAQQVQLKRRERILFLEQELAKNEVQDTEQITKQLKLLLQEKTRVQERSTVLYNRIRNNERIRENVDKKLEEREQLQKEYSSVQILSAVANGELSGRDRLPFEQYVQAFYFEQVIYEANFRLKQMSGGRYALLRKKEAENKRSVTGLDLEIMDYFTGKARSVKSLSGGESFKAALSLALGLSDVIQSFAGGVIVETMFIDEGFGSLDKDSLEQAVNLLKSLALDHRIVGIISHVEELKECIEQRIQLEKGSQGSTICF